MFLEIEIIDLELYLNFKRQYSYYEKIFCKIKIVSYKKISYFNFHAGSLITKS